MKAWIRLLINDLKLFWRSPENLWAMLLFGLTVLVVFHFSLPAASSRSIFLGCSALWLALALSSILGIPPLQHRPNMTRFLPQLMTGNVSSVGYFWEKFLVGFLLMVLSGVIIFPVVIVLFNFPLSGKLIDAAVVLLVGMVGITLVLTLVASITLGQESWIFPVLALPLLIPVVLAGVRVTAGIISSSIAYPSAWYHILIAYDLLMLFGGWLLSEFLWTERPSV